MRVSLCFVVLPTPALVQLAAKHGFSDVVQAEAWPTYEHDPTGIDYSKEEVEKAVWTVFLGNFDLARSRSPESEAFFTKCVELGLSGCWDVHLVGANDDVEELLEKAKEYEPFAKENLKRVQK